MRSFFPLVFFSGGRGLFSKGGRRKEKKKLKKKKKLSLPLNNNKNKNNNTSVMPDLLAATAAAEASGASVVLVNPILKDVQSSGGVMSVRGRDERLAAAASFVPGYHFRPLFVNPTMPFPIRGALRLSWEDRNRRRGGGKEEGVKWQVYAREDLAAAAAAASAETSSSSSSSAAAPVPWSQRETFILAGERPFDLDGDKGGEPTGAEITAILRERRERVAAAERAVREEAGGEKRKGWWW